MTPLRASWCRVIATVGPFAAIASLGMRLGGAPWITSLPAVVPLVVTGAWSWRRGEDRMAAAVGQRVAMIDRTLQRVDRAKP